jgi:hypothetical protein
MNTTIQLDFISKKAKTDSTEKKEPKSQLQITSVPVAERIDPKENRYILVIRPQGIRAAAGQYTAAEAHEIARLTKKWDWTLDASNRPQCLPALEALLTSIVKRSTSQGVEA